MSDSAIFTIGMFLLGPAIIVIFLLVAKLALRRRPGPAAKLGCALLVLLGVAAFCGIMVASAGGAIHPPLVERAAPYACDGTVERLSQNYSYKPGQQGVSHTIYCIAPDGTRRDITLRAIGAASIYYGLYAFGGLILLGLLLALFRPRRTDSEIADANALASALRDKMAERLRTDADIVRRPAAPSDAGGGSVEDRLRHLQSLRDGGLISEEEYRAKRAEILGGL